MSKAAKLQDILTSNQNTVKNYEGINAPYLRAKANRDNSLRN